MTWPCRLLDVPPLDKNGYVDEARARPGDMWFLDKPDEELRLMHLTAHYWQHNAPKRKPLVCLLPRRVGGVIYFTVDGQCYNAERGYYDAWTVEGDAPRITVAPSIDYTGGYHGFLANGVLGPDLDAGKK